MLSQPLRLIFCQPLRLMFLQPLRLMFLQPCKAHVKPAMAHVDSAFELTPSQLARITFMQPLVFMFNQLESSCPAFTAHAFHTGMHTRLPWQAHGTLTCRCQLNSYGIDNPNLIWHLLQGEALQSARRPSCEGGGDTRDVSEDQAHARWLIHAICAGQDISKGMSLSESSGLSS